MGIFKNKVTIESKKILEPYFKAYEYRTSGMSFSSLYMWRNENDFTWEIIGEYLFVSGLSHLEIEKHEYFVFPPLTKTGFFEPEKLKESLIEVKARMEAHGEKFTLRLVPAHMRAILEAAWGKVRYEDDRPNYDYLYEKQALIELKGKKLHGKKNHLNYFKNNFEYEYVELKPYMVDTVMQFLDEFNSRKDLAPHEMEWLMMETDAMRDVVLNLDKLEYIAGAIVIAGKVEAFSIGAKTGGETVTVHVEKANSQIRGLYPAINNEFCKALPEEIKFVNREEDMGIENLRKAKLSYKPVELIEKFIVYFD